MVERYLYIVNRVIFPCGMIIFEGVCHKDFVCYSDHFIVTIDEVEWCVSKEDAGVTTVFTRSENIDSKEYIARKYNDKTKDYMQKVKEEYGIDMKLNYEPQFRDGVNPAKDKKYEG